MARGELITVRAVAQRYGISPPHAGQLLAKISRVVPIYNDCGLWRPLNDARQVSPLRKGKLPRDGSEA
jgi:hypothetical protein